MGKIKYILSVIHYTIHYTISGALCFQFTHSPCDDWEDVYNLSYYHHQIGSMNYYPLFMVRSWNNCVRCMSFYILMGKVFENINGLRTDKTTCSLMKSWRRIAARPIDPCEGNASLTTGFPSQKNIFCNFKIWYTFFLSGTDNDVEDFVWWSHGNIISVVGISVTIIIALGFLIHWLSNMVLNCCVQCVCNQVIAHPRMWHVCYNAIAITQWTMMPWHPNMFRITDPFWDNGFHSRKASNVECDACFIASLAKLSSLRLFDTPWRLYHIAVIHKLGLNCEMYPKFVEKGWEQVAFLIHRKISNINCTKSENLSDCRIVVSSCSWLCPIHWSQVFS